MPGHRVLQRKADRDEPEEKATGLTLLWYLVHRPVWLGGIAALLVAFSCKPPYCPPRQSRSSSRSRCWSCRFTLLLAGMVSTAACMLKSGLPLPG
jgi:hypothetical protein